MGEHLLDLRVCLHVVDVPALLAGHQLLVPVMQILKELLVIRFRVLILLLELLRIVNAVIRFKLRLVPPEIIFPVGNLGCAISDPLGVTLVIEPVIKASVRLVEEGRGIIGAELEIIPCERFRGEGDQEGPGELKERRVLSKQLMHTIEEEMENWGEAGLLGSMVILKQRRFQAKVLREVMVEEMPFLVEKGTKSIDSSVVGFQE